MELKAITLDGKEITFDIFDIVNSFSNDGVFYVTQSGAPIACKIDSLKHVEFEECKEMIAKSNDTIIRRNQRISELEEALNNVIKELENTNGESELTQKSRDILCS